MKKKKGGGGGGANWMDTYGDMVTLLLCFFVLLYSMSTVDQSKWKALVQSFNPNAIETETEITGGNDGPSADNDDGTGLDGDKEQQADEEEKTPEEQQAEIDQAMDALYQALKAYAAESEAGQSIDVTKGDGYVFVSFNEAVFFNGDSYELRDDGKSVLDAVCEVLSKASAYLDEVRIMGHTAQASATRPNNPVTDRFLSSNRATVTTVYIQEHSTVDPARLVSVGYGQHRPVDTNDTPEGRSHNRRVEIAITGLDVYDQMGDSIQQYYSQRSGGSDTASTAT